MKKLICFVLCAVTLLSLAACNKKDEEEKSSYKQAVENFIDTQSGKATEKQLKAMFPQEVWKYHEEVNDQSMDSYLRNYERQKDDLLEMLEDRYGKNVKITYKITDKTALEKDELEDMADRWHDQYGISKDAVKQGFALSISISFKGSEDTYTQESTINVVKIGSDWYCANF